MINHTEYIPFPKRVIWSEIICSIKSKNSEVRAPDILFERLSSAMNTNMISMVKQETFVKNCFIYNKCLGEFILIRIRVP